MNAQGVTPPNLPIPSDEDDKKEIPPVIPQASPARGGLNAVPATEKQTPPSSPEASKINTKPPGGGLDAPDPFMTSQGASQDKATKKPLVDSGRSEAATIPPATSATGSISAPSVGVGLGTMGKPPQSAGLSDATPIPPVAFREPEPPRRGRRKVAVIIGGIVTLLLLMAIGFVAARYIMSNFGQSNEDLDVIQEVEEQSGDNIQVDQTGKDLLENNSVIPTESVVPEEAEIPAETTMDSNGTLDLDQDGLTEDEEKFYKTDPNVADTDGDGYIDGDEVRSGYDPLGPGKLDSDNDGFADPDEKEFGTDPFNPDTDGDGYSDGDEIQNGYNPLIPSPGDKL